MDLIDVGGTKEAILGLRLIRPWLSRQRQGKWPFVEGRRPYIMPHNRLIRPLGLLSLRTCSESKVEDYSLHLALWREQGGAVSPPQLFDFELLTF